MKYSDLITEYVKNRIANEEHAARRYSTGGVLLSIRVLADLFLLCGAFVYAKYINRKWKRKENWQYSTYPKSKNAKGIKWKRTKTDKYFVQMHKNKVFC